MEEDELELSTNFFLNYQVFARHKKNHLSRHTISELDELAVIDLSRLNKFVVSSKRFGDLLASGDPYPGVLGIAKN